LPTLPLKGVLVQLGDKCDSGNKDYSICFRNSALEKFVINAPVKYHTCSITKALAWIDIPKKHERHSRLEVDDMLRKAVWSQGV
jgi:hypothetical protein